MKSCAIGAVSVEKLSVEGAGLAARSRPREVVVALLKKG